jgi:hypothetical protein
MNEHKIITAPKKYCLDSYFESILTRFKLLFSSPGFDSVANTHTRKSLCNAPAPMLAHQNSV